MRRFARVSPRVSVFARGGSNYGICPNRERLTCLAEPEPPEPPNRLTSPSVRRAAQETLVNPRPRILGVSCDIWSGGEGEGS